MSMTVTETLQQPTETLTLKSAEEMFLAPDLETMEELERGKRKPVKIVWLNVFVFAALHVAALVGFYEFVFNAMWLTRLWTFALYIFSGVGITAGAHRLWAHRSYKATLPARIGLMIACTVAFQNDVIDWARDHRCHHKWTDTTADPHDSKRGFFFAHVGWLMAKKDKAVRENGAKIDLSDLFNDPVLSFQRKHYYKLAAIFTFLLPAVIPMVLWGESGWIAFYSASIFRLIFVFNCTWLINSAAHTFGYKPYDASISPVESVWTNVGAVGEGGHNFHHTFPQDYRASEFSYITNITLAAIDAMAYLGMAYDRKTVSDEAINRQKEKKGDPHYFHHHH